MDQSVSTRIMVIGTDLHFCYLMRRYVRESAHPLLFSAPDDQALDIVLREKPALIVLEGGHSDTKSLQILNTLKSNHHTCQIPVVFCSWQDEALDTAENSAVIYLRMPVLYADFLALLASLGI